MATGNDKLTLGKVMAIIFFGGLIMWEVTSGFPVLLTVVFVLKRIATP